ncbi:MAG: GTPase, partial [Cyanobacteriota bacterium]|nr:GTPase [Cyanobacteriota bacterium]
MSEIKILMLGSSGVGKTSLLASMYEQFQTTSSLGNFEISPQGVSAAILNKRLNELKKMLARGQDGSFNVQPGEGIQGTSATNPKSIRSFVFDMGLKGSKTFMTLHFYDYPGGYISQEAKQEEKQFVQKLLNDASVVIITIDTPALVMQKGKYNEYVNKPQQITEMFQEAYRNLQEPRLVLLAPVKCEMEMRRGERSANKLLNSVTEKYANLLTFFKSPFLAEKVAVAVTPVQTLGCVECSRMDNKTTDYRPIFCFK